MANKSETKFFHKSNNVISFPMVEFRDVPELYGMFGNFRNVLEYRSGNFPEKSFQKFPEQLVPELN